MTKASSVIFAWVCHLLVLLHFDTRSRCEAASISCQNERECANGTLTNLIGSDQSIECDGYRSCMNLDSISIDQDPDPSSYFITCRGSQSCYKTSNIYTFKSASIQCYGLQSCSFVENITIISSSNAGVIYGYGELSLYKSKIYDTGTLLCYGDYACSNIYTNGVKYIWGKGRMSMSNSIFVNNIDNGLSAFYFIGYLAGYNSTIYCNYQCDIQCYGNGCIGLNIICNDTNTDFYLCTLDCNNAGTNDNITNSNEYSCPTMYYTSENDISTIESSIATTIAQISSIYNNELTIPIFDVFSDSDSISICDSDVSTSYLCGDYEECLSASIITSNSNDKDICCSARFGCNVATRIENDNFISASDINRIRCDGHGACRDVINSISIATIPSSMDIIGKIYCSAMSSCEYSDMYIESSNNNNYDNGNGNVIYCSAYSSCQFSSIINGDSNMEIHCSSYISCWHMTIRGIKNIYVTGQNAMTGAKIYSDNRNITMNLYLSSYNAGTGNPDTFMVYCNGDDICNIYCQTDYACEGMIVYCVALSPGITNCNIDCDDSSISSNCPTVNITSKLFNQTTGNPTTAIPTATPTAIPTYAPTVATITTTTTTIGMHATTMSPTINTPGNTNNTNNTNNNNNNSNNNNNTSTYTSNNENESSTSTSGSANTNPNTNTKYMNDTGGNNGDTNENGENNDGSDNNNGDNNQSDQISLFIVIAVSSGVTIFLIICMLLIGFCLYRKHQKNKQEKSSSINTDKNTMNDISNNTLASDVAMATANGTASEDIAAHLETNEILNSNVHAELEPGQVEQGQRQGQSQENRKSNESEEHDHSTSSLLYPQSNDVPMATSDAIQGEAKNTEMDSGDQMMAMKLQMEMLMGIDANTTTTGGGGGNGVTHDHGMQIRLQNVGSNSNSNDYDAAVNLADSFANEYNKTKKENEQLENEIYGNGKRNNGRYQTPTHGAIHHYHRTPHGHGTRGGQAGGDGHGNGHGNGNMRMPPLALHGNLKYQLSNNSNDSYEYDNNNENNENKRNNGEQNGEDDRRVSSVEGQIKQRG